jgi:putative SOS response-associated peptidase YedK
MTDSSKQPVRVAMRDEEPFVFAGLWSRWGPKDGQHLVTCTIITTEANELCQPVHDRMPVILARDNYERWLDVSESDPADVLRPYDSAVMRAYPVSTRVNSPKNDDAELIKPLSIAWGAGSIKP